MTLLKVILDVFRSRANVEGEMKDKYLKNEVELRTHLRMLDRNAIRDIRQSTDEAAEFRYDKRA